MTRSPCSSAAPKATRSSSTDPLFQEQEGRRAPTAGSPGRKLPPAPPLPLHQFCDAVAGKAGQPLVTPREAAARVAVMEAAYKAARSQSWVRPA